MSQIYSWGVGLARYAANGQMLDCFFPAPLIHIEGSLADTLNAGFERGVQEIGAERLAAVIESLPENVADALRPLTDTRRNLVSVLLPEDEPIASTAEAYLKLHLLSHRLTLPNTQNLDGIFAALPNVAWTSQGPILAEELSARVARAHLDGEHIEVFSVDKFPKMTNYVVPSGVRIADASRIRLGAYVGDGTTVMHEGQINFNAAAVGPNMVEGRISQGVILGADSDLGGGASTMGTLSGGNEIKVSIGKQCLVGANGGTGIPLGDRCTIEAGLYITGSTPVVVLDEHGEEVKTVKARELAGGSDLLFIRNGVTGQVQCRTNRNAIALNDALHAHN